MKKLITLNSKHAGGGKTSQDIFIRIKNHIDNYENVLIVLPSINLQNTYKEKFNIIQIINHTTVKSDTVPGFIIKKLSTTSSDEPNVLCITHKSFTSITPKTIIKSKFHLIIDEAIEQIYRPITGFGDKNQDNSNVIRLLTKIDNSDYFSIESNKIFGTIANESVTMKKLTDNNWNTEVTELEYDKFKPGSLKNFTFYQWLKPEILYSWKSIAIFAAGIEKTLMYKWLCHAKFKFNYTSIDHHFVPNIVNVCIYHTDEKLSLSKLKDDENLMQDFHDKFCMYSNIYNSLVCTNKDIKLNLYDSETKLQNNMHGCNSNTDRVSAMYLTTRRQNSQFYKWLKLRFNITEKDYLISTDTYNSYQLLHRTASRDNSFSGIIHFGIPCIEIAELLILNFMNREKL